MDNPFDLIPDANEILRKRDWDVLNPKKITFKEQQEQDRKERNALAAVLWKAYVGV